MEIIGIQKLARKVRKIQCSVYAVYAKNHSVIQDVLTNMRPEETAFRIDNNKHINSKMLYLLEKNNNQHQFQLSQNIKKTFEVNCAKKN